LTFDILKLHGHGRLTDISDFNFAATIKEHQSPSRLMNILFSYICEGFAKLGNVTDWVEIVTGKVDNNQLFWEGVQEEFEGQDEAYDNIHFVDDEFLSELHHINFSKVVPHSWKTLRTMWKRLNVEYKAALCCFTLSVTHSSNLCLGNMI